VIGKINDVRQATTMDVKRPGDLVYVLGLTRDERGGSEYYAMRGELGRNVPKVDAKSALERYRALNTAQARGLVASCHDLSDGGLGVALAESAFAGGYGIQVELVQLPVAGDLRDDVLLFSESQSRLLVTVHPEHLAAFEELFAGQDCGLVGRVIEEQELLIFGREGQILVKSPLSNLKEAWQRPLREL